MKDVIVRFFGMGPRAAFYTAKGGEMQTKPGFLGALKREFFITLNCGCDLHQKTLAMRLRCDLK
jgi:hypothetical protein